MRISRWFAIIAWAAVVICGPVLVRAQDPLAPLDRQRQLAVLETDTAAEKKLGVARDYLRAGEWAEAIDLLHRILEDHQDKLIASEPGRYVDLHRHCHAMLATMPADGLQVYRRRMDAQARGWFQAGRDRRDKQSLLKVTQYAYVSSYGDDALLLLGEFAWERGAISQARNYWEQVLPLNGTAATPGDPLPILTYPDTDLDQAAVLARLVLCSIAQGKTTQAEDELEAFAAQHGQATGTLSGRKGTLAGILGAIFREAGQWRAVVHDSEIATFALNAQRNKMLAEAVDDIGAVHWSVPLPRVDVQPMQLRRPGGFKELPRPAALSYFPVVYGDVVLVNDAGSVYAYDLQTGKPAWSADESGDAAIYRSLEEPVGPRDERQRPFEIGVVPRRGRQRAFRIGVPRFTMTVHGGRLYARMGPPITDRAERDVGSVRSHLACLDLERGEGKVVWTIDAGTFDESETDWEFEGSPVVTDSRLYVALRKSSPLPQANVACFDSEDGSLIWNRKICATLKPLADNVSLVSHNLLTLAEGRLYYATNLGAIAALETENGHIEWVVTYQPAQDQGDRPFARQFKDGLIPCLFADGTVIASPADLKQFAVADPLTDRQKQRQKTVGNLIALDASTGVLKWTQELAGGVRHLLGTVEGRLIVAGDSLWWIDLETGKIVHRFGHNDPESFSYGRGLLAGGRVFWPHRDTIWVYNASDGKQSAELKLQGWRDESGIPLTGGNLTIAGGFLLVAQQDRLVAYAQWGRRKLDLKRLISAKPRDALLHFQLAQAEEATGEWKAALAAYRVTLARAADDDRLNAVPLKGLAAGKLYRLLIKVGTEATARQDFDRAAATLREAVAVAADIGLQLQAIVRLAESYDAAGGHEQAVAAYQQILDDPLLAAANCRDDERTVHAGRLTQLRILSLIAQHGRGVYARHDRAAGQQFAAALNGDDLDGLQSLLQRYPNARSTEQAWLGLAKRYADGRDWNQAVRAYETLLRQQPSPEHSISALAGLARTLEQQEFWHEASVRWKQLAKDFSTLSITKGAADITVAQFVADRLQQTQFDRQRDSHNETWKLPLKRTGELNRPADSRVVVPEGVAPSLASGCVLLGHNGVRCVDPNDGTTRWTADVNGWLLWACYDSTRIVFATTDSVTCAHLDDGALIWQRPFPASTFGNNGQEPLPRFAHRRGRVLCQHHGGEVICLDAWDGRDVWQFRPQPGTLERPWLCTDEVVVLQILRPNQIVVLDAATGLTVASKPGPVAAWPHDPLPMRDGFLTITSQGGIVFREMSTGETRWTYDGPVTKSNTLPDAISNGKQLVLLLDGDTLVGIDPQTGRKQWSHGLGIAVLRDARHSICIDDESVFAVTAGIARCIGLVGGELKWEQFVGLANTEWAVHKAGAYVAVYPHRSAKPDLGHLVICDAKTGAYVQRVRIDTGAGDIRLHPHPTTSLLTTANRLLVFTTIAPNR